MTREQMIEILKAAGYTETAAKKGIDLGTVIMDDLEDFRRELPDTDPETVKYKGIKYYIAYAD